MAPFPVTARYRYSEDGESRDASFHGLFFDRSEQAVVHRLEEVHRFAAWVELIEVRWREGGVAREDRRDDRRCSVPSRDRSGCIIPRHACGGGARSGDMEVEMTAPDDTAGAARGGGHWRPRRHARCRMFKPAHVVLEDAVLDCVLLALSPGGAQVCLMAGAELPDRAVLWLPTGESWPVRRAWQEGSLVGFEAVENAVPPS